MTCEILLNFAFEGSIAPHSSWSIMGILSVKGKSKFFSPYKKGRSRGKRRKLDKLSSKRTRQLGRWRILPRIVMDLYHDGSSPASIGKWDLEEKERIIFGSMTHQEEARSEGIQ